MNVEEREKIEYESPLDRYRNDFYREDEPSFLYETRRLDLREGNHKSILGPKQAVVIEGDDEDFSIKALSEAGSAFLSYFDEDDFGYAEDFYQSDNEIRGKVERERNSNISLNKRLSEEKNISNVIKSVLDKFDSDESLAGLFGGFGHYYSRNYYEFDNSFEGKSTPDFRFYVPSHLICFDEQMEESEHLKFSFRGKTDELSFSSNLEEDKFSGLEEKVMFEDMSSEEYEDKVRKIKDHIFDGDVFQTVLSRKVGVPTQDHPLDSYEELTDINPSPYCFFFNFSDDEFLYGASPELHTKVEDDEVVIKPIAGTTSLNPDDSPGERENDVQDLLRDRKEQCEHRMLVDLARSDINFLDRGSAEVDENEYMYAVRYMNLAHIETKIRGNNGGYDTADVLKKTGPGTLIGGPKEKSLNILEDLENSPRSGFYGGGVGYIGFNGDCDTAIVIRSVYSDSVSEEDYKYTDLERDLGIDHVSYARAGAGIVADSDPKEEAEEVMNKLENQIEVLT